MTKINKPKDIWVLTAEEDDLINAAKYAAVTLPWTFNRMMANTSSKGQQSRGLNIAKGILAQEMLHRALTERGIKADVERKCYRDDDLFDFMVSVNGKNTKIDLKSVIYFSDYHGDVREPLTPELIIRRADYSGSDWRYFFPMLIPHTQINQPKELYCFSIANTFDFRKDVRKGRKDYYKTARLTAYPYGENLPFLSSSKLCNEREKVGQGIYIKVSYFTEGLFGGLLPITLKIIGEWDGKGITQEVEVKGGETIDKIGPFSCISAFQISAEDYDELNGSFEISIDKNELKGIIRNTQKVNINIAPSIPLVISKADFCNLYLPDSYKLLVLGWISKEEFLENVQQYSAWVWPKDSVSKYDNQLWSQITEKDHQLLEKLGYEYCIQRNPSRINVGLMKTTGRGQGACCYYFPNIFGGGIHETNLYVLPQDLNKMDDLTA